MPRFEHGLFREVGVLHLHVRGSNYCNYHPPIIVLVSLVRNVCYTVYSTGNSLSSFASNPSHVMKRSASSLSSADPDGTSSTTPRQPTVSDSQGSEPVSRTTNYFDTIPVELSRAVVKHLSEEPYSQNWLHSVNASDARTVLQVGGVLSVASRGLFKSLVSGEFKFRNWHEHTSLAITMAPHLTRLTIAQREHRRINCEQLCSLRELRISFGAESLFERILNVCGGSLEKLDIIAYQSTKKIVEAIASNCKSLKSFHSGFTLYRASLEPLWSVVGNTLIELRGELSHGELMRIARHCTRLEKLDLLNLHKFAAATLQNIVTDYLASLKSLGYLLLDLYYEGTRHLDIDFLRAILHACPPNVWIDCTMGFNFGDSNINNLRVVGPRLRKLVMDYESGTLPRDLLPALGNVQELLLVPYQTSDEMIESIFVEPLPCLRKLSILVNNPTVLRSIARSVSSLREFVCSFSFRFNETSEDRIAANGSAITELLQANEHLRYIKMTYWHAEHIVDFVRRLRVCRNLEHVAIGYRIQSESRKAVSESKEISNACVPLRTRSLSLSVNGMRYLPR